MDKFIQTTLKMHRQLNNQLKPVKSTLKMVEQAQPMLKFMNDLAVSKNIEKNMSIGERIKQLRKEQKLSQGELAEKSNLTRNTIGHYERGERKASINVISQIAKAFNISTNEFLKPCEENRISPDEEFKNSIIEFLQEKNLKDKFESEEDIKALQDKITDLINYESYKKSHK